MLADGGPRRTKRSGGTPDAANGRVKGLWTMAGKTITRADLCEAVYQKVGLSRTESADLVEMVLGEISDCLVEGESVKLSSFGTFLVRSKGERIGRNPKTGEEVPISPRRVMVFKPSNVLKQKINESLAGDEG